MTADPKMLAGVRAAEYVEAGMVVGLGTGSTAYFAIRRLGERARAGLVFRGLPTSEQSRALAIEEGITLVDFSEVSRIDITIDGADEVDPSLNLIKGGGGALLREKIVASATDHEIIVVDESKPRAHLGAFPLPVEVTPFGWQLTRERIDALGCRSELRRLGTAPFRTDNGNYVLDCAFGCIDDPPDLERRIISVCGAVECGLFTDLTDRVIVGMRDGKVEETTRSDR